MAAYLGLLEAELRGEVLTKTLVNRGVQERIGRSKGSIEYKFQNVSAVLRDLRHPFVKGYKPAVNYQDSLTQAVLRGLARSPSLAEAAFEQFTADPPRVQWDIAWSDEPAPVIEFGDAAARRRRAVKVDFVRLDEANRRLGRAGELAVLERERKHLKRLGLPHLARQVEHVSETQGDGLGFDVLSFTPEGVEKFIEVKTTRQGKHWPMVVSRNERDFSIEEPGRFHLYRLFDFTESKVGLYVLKGSIVDTCQLQPHTFQAWPRSQQVG